MRFCNFENDRLICDACGKRAPNRHAKSRCLAFLSPSEFQALLPAEAKSLLSSVSHGPGTEVKALLAKIGITASPDCKCNSRAAYMDKMEHEQPGWCEAHIDEIVGWLRESAAERGLPFVDIAGRVLVRRAIANARRKEQARAQEASQAEGPAPAG